MQYVIKQVNCCPEGAVQSTRYHVAGSEDEMDRIMSLKLGSYSAMTCLGPTVGLSEFTSGRA